MSAKASKPKAKAGMLGKDLGITPVQSLFLLVLYNSPSLSGSEIVQKLSDDLGDDWTPTPGATYKIIQALQKEELIQETTDTENRKDQRIRTYSLTDKGKAMVTTVTARVSKIVSFMNTCCPEATENIIVVKKDGTNFEC
ncbi:MAG: PadR family transcriptional regulator [Candidatus Hodarchaeales archaeon]